LNAHGFRYAHPMTHVIVERSFISLFLITWP
jgi:hypothetical protein